MSQLFIMKWQIFHLLYVLPWRNWLLRMLNETSNILAMTLKLYKLSDHKNENKVIEDFFGEFWFRFSLEFKKNGKNTDLKIKTKSIVPKVMDLKKAYVLCIIKLSFPFNSWDRRFTVLEWSKQNQSSSTTWKIIKPVTWFALMFKSLKRRDASWILKS